MAKIENAATRALTAKRPASPSMVEHFTLDEAAAMVKKAPKTIANWVSARMIDSVRVGNRILIPRSEIDRLLAEGYRPRQDKKSA